MVTLYMLDAVDIKIDIIDINRYLKYIIDIIDINIGIYFGHEWAFGGVGRFFRGLFCLFVVGEKF